MYLLGAMAKTLIWWLSQYELEEVEEALKKLPNEDFPEWLMSELRSAYGRNGRGRLWAAKQFEGASVDPWPSTPMGKYLGRCAGICISEAEIELLNQLPGIVTDTKLERYHPQPKAAHLKDWNFFFREGRWHAVQSSMYGVCFNDKNELEISRLPDLDIYLTSQGKDKETPYCVPEAVIEKLQGLRHDPPKNAEIAEIA